VASAEEVDTQAIIVHPGPGTPIQDAINGAQSGATIKILPGTYHEELYINKDGLTLEGAGGDNGDIESASADASKVVIQPPLGPHTSPCAGPGFTGVGICVANPPDNAGNVTIVVNNVHIRNLTVRDVDGPGIFAFGTDNLHIDHVIASGNSDYGVFANSSTNTVLEDNLTEDNGEAGLYVGDSPQANALVLNNTSRNNLGSGILVRDASMGTVANNHLSDNCIGIALVNTGSGESDWIVRHNEVFHNNKACPGAEHGPPPPISGVGIGLAGTTNITVEDNEVKDHDPGTNPSFVRGGIGVISFLGLLPVGNTVRGNELDGNLPADIVWDLSGHDNLFMDNVCLTSLPPGLCA
jgi:parallel beta-helix repeat protein